MPDDLHEPGRYTGRMKPIRLLLIASAFALPLAAAAQWQWIDKDGRKVFSDRPPPQDVPQNKILRQPAGSPMATPAETGATAGSTATAATPAAAPAAAGSGLKVQGKDKELEARKKQAENAEAEKKKAEEAKLAEAKADNCKRAKQNMASFDSGVRIAVINPKGEREYMDDKQRAEEIARLKTIIARDCKG